MKKEFSRDSRDLVDWYRKVRRTLPWRQDRDPYRIWISEVMLQQTTVVAVIPFYERFLKRFPTLESLARSPIGDVLEHWAGLGYYSRARNLHRAAQALLPVGFPRTHTELSELPGFGPYTARAVSSLAFDEKTGVLDGNVIRILSRRYGLAVEWWKPKGRNQLQEIADHLAQVDAPADLNQGMMELGATICTPRSPACLLCPWSKVCVARREGLIETLPLKKPRRETEIWKWRVQVVRKGQRILLVPNDYAPFLKGHWILPGSVQRLDTAPKSFAFRGSVTHHDIFAQVARTDSKRVEAREKKWVDLADLKREIPVSLIRKAIEAGLEKDN
jgi:A/G-specific adenine glycosylase